MLKELQEFLTDVIRILPKDCQECNYESYACRADECDLIDLYDDAEFLLGKYFNQTYERVKARS